MWFKKKESVVANKGDYVVVLHHWFGAQNKGWQSHTLKDVTEQEAINFGNMKVGEMSDTFNHVSFHVVEYKG